MKTEPNQVVVVLVVLSSERYTLSFICSAIVSSALKTLSREGTKGGRPSTCTSSDHLLYGTIYSKSKNTHGSQDLPKLYIAPLFSSLSVCGWLLRFGLQTRKFPHSL